MVLVQFDKKPPNKTLKGHKLLVVLPSWKPAQEDVDEVKAQFPDLEVIVGEISDITKEQWKDTTVLLTGYSRAGLPEKDLVPKLEYIQLSSAGANAVVTDPLFTDTDVAFCTANGVHG